MQIRPNCGFTLVEVMMVLMVVSILTAIALPSMRTHMLNAEIRGIAEEMRNGLELARMEAIRRNDAVRFDRSGSGWNVVVPGTGGIADETLGMRAARLTQVNVSADVDTITFTGSGWTTPFGGTMNINFQTPDAGQCRPLGAVNCLTVVVAAGGLVRTCDPAAASGSVTACN